MNGVMERIEKDRLIVILRNIASRDLFPLVEALYRGGVRVLELPFDATGRVSDVQTAKHIETVVKHVSGHMAVGAGTVLTEQQAILTQRAGGQFALSPDVNVRVIQRVKELGLVSVPGAFTPSEITAAHRVGADLVKLFPVGALGPAYIKQLRAPLSHVKFLAVGGIHKENMADYLRAGAIGVGVGAALTDKKMIEEKNFDAICHAAAEYVDIIRSVS